MLTSGAGGGAGSVATHDQFAATKMMYTSSPLSKPSSIPTTSGGGEGTVGLGGAGGVAGGGGSSFKHNYDGSKSTSGSGAYNYSVAGNQGYISAYMGVSDPK